MRNNFKMDKATLIRTLVLIAALANQALVAFGLSPLPFTPAEIEAGLASLFTVLASLWAWYKNNDTTPEAQQGTRVTRELKAKKKRGDR